MLCLWKQLSVWFMNADYGDKNAPYSWDLVTSTNTVVSDKGSRKDDGNGVKKVVSDQPPNRSTLCKKFFGCGNC